MRRREFIAGLGSAAAWPTAWPAMVGAQPTERQRRIGVLMSFAEGDPDAEGLVSAFMLGLSQLGWIDGRNVRIFVRWAASDPRRMVEFAKEMVDLQPDVILSHSTPVTAALQRETQTLPIVFLPISDPVGAGFVASLARPGGNLTGFINMEAGMGGKWVELLTEIAPGVKRVAAMFNPATSPASYYLGSLEAAARSLRVEPISAPVRSESEIEMAIISLGREPGGGLVVIPDAFTFTYRASIILRAAQNKIPAVYWRSVFARDGGLVAYGPDAKDIFQRSAMYFDRILRGAKPSELPVQVPTKYEMALNVKTAKALGLHIPQSILLRADEVIE